MAYKQQAELTNMIKTVRILKKQNFGKVTGTDIITGMGLAFLLRPKTILLGDLNKENVLQLSWQTQLPQYP